MNNRPVELLCIAICTILMVQSVSADNYLEFNYTDPEDDLSYSMRFPDSMDSDDRLPCVKKLTAMLKKYENPISVGSLDRQKRSGRKQSPS